MRPASFLLSPALKRNGTQLCWLKALCSTAPAMRDGSGSGLCFVCFHDAGHHMTHAQGCLFSPNTLAFIANRMRQLQIALLVGAPRPLCTDMIKAWSPLLPERCMGKLEPVPRHGLTTQRTFSRLRLPKLPKKRRVRGGVRNGHYAVRRSGDPK